LRFLRAGVAQVEKNGAFVIRGLVEGSYAVEARHDAWSTVKTEPVLVSGSGPAPSLTLKLEKGLTLLVTVEGPEGASGPGIFVQLRGPDKLLLHQTDAEGRVRFQGLSPSTYWLRAQAGRTKSERVSVAVTTDRQEVVLNTW
jgi:hypothetical protein